jgi:hypothetical protein
LHRAVEGEKASGSDGHYAPMVSQVWSFPSHQKLYEIKRRNGDARRPYHRQGEGEGPSLPIRRLHPVDAVKLKGDTELKTPLERRVRALNVPTKEDGRVPTRERLGLDLGVDHLTQLKRGNGDGRQGGNGKVYRGRVVGHLLKVGGPTARVSGNDGGGGTDDDVGSGGAHEARRNRAADAGRAAAGNVGGDLSAGGKVEMFNARLSGHGEHDLDDVLREVKGSGGANDGGSVGGHVGPGGGN